MCKLEQMGNPTLATNVEHVHVVSAIVKRWRLFPDPWARSQP